LQLAYYYKANNMFKESLSWFDKAQKLEPKNTDILLHIGLLTSWIGEYEKAIEYFDDIIKIDPNYNDAKLAKARVLSWQDKRAQAIKLCDEVISGDPDYIDAYGVKARILMWNADFKGAEEAYTKMLELDPDNKQAQMLLSNMLAAQGYYESAIGHYKKMLKKYPDDVELLNGLGKVLSWKGDYDNSIITLKKTIQIDPVNTEAIDSLARIYRWSKRYNEGIQLQQKILEQNKLNTKAFMEIALLYEMQGDYKKAIEWYEKAKVSATDPQINARLGLLYSKSGQVNEAITTLQKVLKEQDNDVESLINLGRVYSWKLKIKEAIELYKQAIILDPDNQEAYIGLGRTYFYDDNWPLAEVQFKKVLEINPLNKEAASELQRINSLKKPRLRSRYNYFSYESKDEAIIGYTGKISRYEIDETVDMYFSPYLSGGIQVKIISEKLFTNNEKRYGLNVSEYAFIINNKFNNQMNLKGKLIAGMYKDNGSKNYILKNDKSLFTGFFLLQYDMDKWFFTMNLAQEPLYPVIRGNDLFIKYYTNTGFSAQYDVMDNLNLLVSLFYKNFYYRYKRNDYNLAAEYTLPFLKQCEVGYSYRFLTEPSDNIYALNTNYKNKFDKLSYSIGYVIENSSYNDILTHAFNVFTYYDINSTIGLNVDINYAIERKGSSNEDFQTKLYTSYQF